MSDSWPWLALAGLGAFHGLNPAMGWLFAVALGLHQRRRAVVLQSLVPIALGHALAVALVALTVVALGAVVEERVIRLAAGALLIGWAIYQRLLLHFGPPAVLDVTGGRGLAVCDSLRSLDGRWRSRVLVDAVARGESPGADLRCRGSR